MPTHDETEAFLRDWARLSPELRNRFQEVLPRFIEAVASQQFPAGLRVKPFRGHSRIWELTFAPDGRALWMHGDPVRPGDPHVIWLRIGTHDIFRK